MSTTIPRPRPRYLAATIRKWQQALRIGDWEIRYYWHEEAPPEWKCAPDTFGRVWDSLEHRRATISVRRDNENPDEDDDAGPARWEATIVHELLHLAVGLLANYTQSGSRERVIEEQLVGALTEALTGYRFVDRSWRAEAPDV